MSKGKKLSEYKKGAIRNKNLRSISNKLDPLKNF